jgi:ribonuclease HII
MYNHDMQISIGIDEAGRGPWAGPVFAGITLLTPEQEQILIEGGVKDSKKISHKKREQLYKLILANSFYAKVKYYNADEIDRLGVYKATQELIKQLVKDLFEQDFIKDVENLEIKIDGLFPGLEFKISSDLVIKPNCIIRGDSLVTSISAASILAKVRRDEFMTELDKKYPDYQFAKHKGYGTKLHHELLKKFGPCEIHRKSFKPIKDLLIQ